MRLLLINYRLAPEVPFPAAVEDAGDLLWSVNQGDPEGMATAALHLTSHPSTLDERALRADIVRAYEQYWLYATEKVSFAAMVEAMRDILSAHGLWLNRDLTLAIKAIAQAEGIAFALQPQMNWVEVAYTEAAALLRAEFTTDRVVEQVKTQAIRGAKELLSELLGLQEGASRWLDQYRRGRFVVEVNTAALADSVTHFSQSMRRVTVALILIGLLMGSVITASLLRTVEDTQWVFLPIVAMGIFIVAALVSVAMVIQMIRADLFCHLL
jgi:predicted unusual protein kinase regulating ubiquinone biosynthesis (AarF/ABC1/UbiB family)